MATPLFFLTAQDAEILKEILASVKKRRQNRPGQSLSEVSLTEGDDYLTPETYTAKPQTQISAISGTTPGTGEVDVYRIDSNGVLVTTAINVTVYNLSSSMMETDSYYLVTRSKYGKWLHAGGSGGSADLIFFKIDSMNPDGSALATITARPCGVTSVPEEIDGQVTVYDFCGCYFDEPDADLIGRCGTARYMDPTGIQSTGTGTADTETGTGTDITQCAWYVDGLCCPQCS